MDITWNDAIARVSAMTENSRVDRSDKHGLVQAFTKAAAWNVDVFYAQCAYIAPISNLKSAASELRRAVRWENPEELARILELCATLSNQDLRLALHTVELETITATSTGEKYTVEMTAEQFVRLQRTMKLRQRYSVKEATQPTEDLNGYDIYQ